MALKQRAVCFRLLGNLFLPNSSENDRDRNLLHEKARSQRPAYSGVRTQYPLLL